MTPDKAVQKLAQELPPVDGETVRQPGAIEMMLAMGQYLARVIPGCRATFCQGEGHLVALTHWEEIIHTVS